MLHIHDDSRASIAPAEARDEWIRHYTYIVLAFGGLYQVFQLVRAGLLGFDVTDWIVVALYLALVGLVLGRAPPRVSALYILAGFAIARILALIETGFSGRSSLLACTLPVLAALFLGGRVPYVAMAGSLGAFAIVGTLHVVGGTLTPVHAPILHAHLLDPKLFVNWVGMGVALVAVVAPSVWVVSRVTSHLDLSMEGLVRARSLHAVQVRLRMEAEAALEKAIERRERARQVEAAGLLISGVVHDLRNTLAALQLWSGSLRTEPTADEDVRDAAERIEQLCTQTAQITGDLLAVARPSHLTSAGSPLWPQVSAAIAILRRALPEDIQVVAEREIDEHLWVGFDASALMSVVLALAADARLGVAARSQIRIVARTPRIDERASLPECVAVVAFVFEAESAPPTDAALSEEVAEQGGHLLIDSTRTARLLLPAMRESDHPGTANG